MQAAPEGCIVPPADARAGNEQCMATSAAQLQPDTATQGQAARAKSGPIPLAADEVQIERAVRPPQDPPHGARTSQEQALPVSRPCDRAPGQAQNKSHQSLRCVALPAETDQPHPEGRHCAARKT